MILAVKNLKKYYGDLKAVNNISFEVKRGTVFSLLGPNGAGKTTTVEILEGLRKKTGGEIYYFGEKVNDITKSIKEKIGVALQKTELFKELTVLETVKLFRSFYQKGFTPKEIVDMVGLNEKAKSRVKNLSGGQLQRLVLGLAFVNDPEIIFLDEPTTGLDPQSRRHIWEIIQAFKKSGKTIFLTTHYMEEAERLADMVCIIDNGKIVASGSPDELIKSSGLKSIIEFQADNISTTHFPNCKKLGDKFFFETTNVAEDIQKLLANGIEDFIVRHPTLEDVFLKLTGKKLRD
ncbi:ABC transporter ATP-binding protein [Thermosipho ferrireducens]|uniref:ABC transporter ATP-binding protein n=1 Tax=Thermosipho ferrireducens TaxID=2571116 RepID=A0ABX7S7U9_9BACT|nr:ABC transporter ATP-binding protein [Thermosipho ferrireducens]QTA37353.1 ABC transporter ATP-binding protein [Thermosipho ferrireducens]